MTVFVGLLRAVNVGGTGKLPMKTLVDLCEAAGLTGAQTYIASGNVLFRSNRSEAAVKARLEAQLETYAGRPIAVIVRSAAEIMDVLARNPFPDQPKNRVLVLFTDSKIAANPLDGAAGLGKERVRAGKRELFIFYPDGQAKTRLRLPAEKSGTARNMNTVAKLAELAGKFA